ncbi:hypothetical protein FOZ63_028567, partial [Perkinsus olseni]
MNSVRHIIQPVIPVIKELARLTRDLGERLLMMDDEMADQRDRHRRDRPQRRAGDALVELYLRIDPQLTAGFLMYNILLSLIFNSLSCLAAIISLWTPDLLGMEQLDSSSDPPGFKIWVGVFTLVQVCHIPGRVAFFNVLLQIQHEASELPPVHRWRSRERAIEDLVGRYSRFSESRLCVMNMKISMFAYFWYVLGVLFALSSDGSSGTKNLMLALILQAVVR